MTGSHGHVEPIAGAPRQPPQPLRRDLPTAGNPAPLPDDSGTDRHGIDLPGTVTAAAVLALVSGVLLMVLVLSTLGAGSLLLVISRLVFPVVLVAGGVQALRGRRGALSTGAVFLVVTGIVLLVQVLGSDGYDTVPAAAEAVVRTAAGVLVLVFSRVPSATRFFALATERRDGRREADFFR